MGKWLKKTVRLFWEGISRFPSAFAFAALLFLFTVIAICTEDEDGALRWAAAAGLAFPVSVGVSLAAERKDPGRGKAALVWLVPTGAFVLCFLFLGEEPFEHEYRLLAYFGIVLSFFIADLLLLFREDNRNLLIPHLLKTAIFSGAVSLILFGGVEISLAAVKFLLWNFDSEIFWKITASIFAFSAELVFTGLVLAALPSPGKPCELKIPKAFRLIVLYVMFPVYLLLLFVLIAYLLKILFTLRMPSGQINWFASFAELFYIFFSYTLFQYGDGPVKLWKRYGGWFLLPIFAAQAVSVYIRVSAYGLTVPRWVSIVLSFSALVFVVLTLIREGKSKNRAGGLLIVLLLISTLTPLNFIDVPLMEQTHRLEAVLTRNGMFDGERVTPAPGLSDDDKAAIVSSYDAIRYEDKAPDWLKDREFEALFGFDHTIRKDTDKVYVSIDTTEPAVLDVSGWNRLIELCCSDDRERVTVVIEDQEYDITDFILSLGEEASGTVIQYDLTEDIRLYFSNIYYDLEDGKISFCSFTARALLK